MATSPQLVQTTSPAELELLRRGGCVIAARIDLWREDQLAGSVLLQKVKLAHEIQHQSLQPGDYIGVLTVRVEESLNGDFAFQVKVSGQDLGSMTGDVNTTQSPNDSRVLRKSFQLRVQ